MTDDQTARPGWRRTLRTVAITAVSTILALSGIVVLGTWWFQRSLLYPGAGAHVAAAPGWTETRTQVPGVGAVSTYVLPARPGMPTVLFFHGNATGYEGAMVATRGFASRGFGVVIPEFPGYAGNPGTTSQETLEALARASMTRLAKEGLPAERIIVYGNSVGAGPAIAAAAMPHGRLLLVSGVASMAEVARHHYFFAHPALVSDPWPNAERLAAVKGRVTVVHAPDDAVVPYAQGEALARASRTQVITVPGGHELAFDDGLQSALAANFMPKGADRAATSAGAEKR